MTKTETASIYTPMSTDRTSFDRWLITNAAIGSLWAAALVAIVVMSPNRSDVGLGIAKAPPAGFSVVASAD